MDVPGTRRLIPPPPAAEEALRRAGLRATRPRLLVYAMLRDWGGHHSADDVLAALQEHGERMSRASVYNVLRDLGARGLIRATGTVHGRAYYEADAPGHHHFICHDCGAIIDVPDDQSPAPPPANLGPGFHIDETQIIYRGRCPDCTTRTT